MSSASHRSDHAASAARSRPMPIAPAAFLFVAAMTGLNAAFNVIAARHGLGFPFTTFLAWPNDNFADFFSLLSSYPGGEVARITDRIGIHAILPEHPLVHRPSPGLPIVTIFHMTPLSTIVSLLLVRVAGRMDAVWLFLVVLAAMAGWWSHIVGRCCAEPRQRLAWIALGLICYPTLMMVIRGNIFAGFTGLLLIDCLSPGAGRRGPAAAAILFALAVNIRPNAILFAIPLLASHWPARTRLVVLLAVAGPVVAGLSLWAASALYPAYDLHSFLAGLKAYYGFYVIGLSGLPYGSSLFGALKFLLAYQGWIERTALAIALAVAAAGTVAYGLGKVRYGTLLFLTAAAYCLGSTVFGDYHLIVFVVVAMTLAIEPGDAETEKAQAARRIMIAASLLMLVPKNYAYLGAGSLQIVLNPLILLTASIVVLAIAASLRTDPGAGLAGTLRSLRLTPRARSRAA